MNKELLERVARHIEANPEEFSMDEWDCGTTACIAGWALRLSGENWRAVGSTEPEDLIDITYEQGSALFYQSGWPHPFRSDYYCAATHVGQAITSAARIRHFIATEGRE